ncbi:TetR/AcrR family transcriptional regulator [Streptomyces sp. NPDC050610]|uniref:TetR/AcrR family transcriptional regulator n=1 Tax=Streptomyces sp. NPDC050610 TaxID=3157097 RepID=UPI00343B1F7C
MPRPRKVRRDAEANRDRLLAAAVAAMLREGRNVPLASIAAEAGLGIGTLYRSYPDRDALLQALEYRAYGLLNALLDEIENEEGISGLDAIARYLEGALAVRDQMVLPLHGAPPLVSPAAVEAREAINRRLDSFIDAGRSDGSVRAPVNATDIIIHSAITTQPLAHGPNWDHIARRQNALFLNGLAAGGPAKVPAPLVERTSIESTFKQHA